MFGVNVFMCLNSSESDHARMLSLMTFRPEIEALLDDFKQRLEVLYGERLIEVVLFGSVARGEDTPESDVDVLVVLRGPVDHYAESEPLSAVMVDLMARYGEFVVPVVMSESTFRTGDWPLLTNVRTEGISL